MWYWARFSCTLLLAVVSVWGEDQAPLHTSAIPRIYQMGAYGNTLALADKTLSTAVSGAEATGGVYISYFDELSDDYNLQTTGVLSEVKLFNPYKFGHFGNPRTDAKGNSGFGQSLAFSSETELFISAASSSTNTGRVYSYKGRHSRWSVMQTLAPHSQAILETYDDIDSYFGGSIAATPSFLVVGCQNCNSSRSKFQQSGEVYLYTHSPSRSYWSEQQTLVVDDVRFLGEHVAIHNDIIVATGDEIKYQGLEQRMSDFPTRAVIFRKYGEESNDDDDKSQSGEFKMQQIITIPNSASYIISEIAVYDETVALSASKYSYLGNPNDIYVFYPNTHRYGGTVDMKPKGPIKWNGKIHILTDRDGCFEAVTKDSDTIVIHTPSVDTIVQIKAMKSRLFEYLPQDIKNILYMDVDILVTKNLNFFLHDMHQQSLTRSTVPDFGMFLDAGGHFFGFCSGCDKWHTGVIWMQRGFGTECLDTWQKILLSGKYDTDQESIDEAERQGKCPNAMSFSSKHLLFAKDYFAMFLTPSRTFVHLTAITRMASQDVFYKNYIVPSVRSSLKSSGLNMKLYEKSKIC